MSCSNLRRGAGTPACHAGLKSGILIFTALFLSACARSSQPGPPPRYAVLRFENLSGNPNLEWICRALDESLPVSLANTLDGPILPSIAVSRAAATLGQRPAAAPGISTERSQAIAAGANRIITGYIEAPAGPVRITAVVRDVITGKTLRTVKATGPTPWPAMNEIARQLSPNAKPPISTNPVALEAYATGFESSGATGGKLFEKATTLDPSFGAAWVARARLDAARNERPAAFEDIAQAKRNKLDPRNLAELDLEAANLSGDRAAALDAMRRVATLPPQDPQMFRALAESETSAGRFKEAAADWAKIAIESPSEPLVWNSLGYARSYSGDYAGALDAFQHYDRLRPHDANPQDSLGDLNYSFRKFKEAAANYFEANRRQPDFEMSADLYKGAWANFEAGNKQEADKLFDRFKTARAKTSPDIAALLAGDWLFRTGRQKNADALVRDLVAGTNNQATRVDGLAQLIVWDLIQGDRQKAAQDSSQINVPSISTPIAIARFSALPSAEVSEWEARAQRIFGPSAGSVGKLAVGYALLFDGKREAAIRAWAEIVRESPATDFLAKAIYSQVQGKPLERPLLPEPANLNPFAGVVKQ